jgi:NitT/TauT family transport system substrate-binding protein
MLQMTKIILLLIALLPQAIQAADKIRIGYSGLSPATAMLWVAHEGKLFEKNGLNPEVLFLRNNLGQSAMIAGEIDMGSYSASLMAPARVQGADLVMIVSFQQKLNYRLVVRPEIRTLADLKGKVLGVTRYGTVNDATMRLLINKLGLDPHRSPMARWLSPKIASSPLGRSRRSPFPPARASCNSGTQLFSLDS